MGINKQFLLNQIIWLGISLGISIIISILLPFPISLVAIVGVFILLSFYMRKTMMKRMGPGIGSDKLKYYCMNCGSQHSQAACPKCGSKMKRVGS
jgi:hypothetical protein